MPLIFSAKILEPNIKQVYHIREGNKLLQKGKKSQTKTTLAS